MRAIGLDIGGAHLKVALLSSANRVEWVMQLPCPLWQGLKRLSEAWREACSRMPSLLGGHYAVTMTGESADCFPSRNDGVSQILDLLDELLPRPFYVYGGFLGLVSANTARSEPERVASLNWHASARLVAEHHRHGVFIDVGSTTTDLVPFANGVPVNRGNTDCQRLACQELIYSGALRTPLMAIAKTIRIGDKTMPVVAEHFATTADIYLLSEDLAPHSDQYPSSDGAPRTRAASARRVARMLACDVNGDEDRWELVARKFAELQYDSILSAYKRLCQRERLARPHPIIAAGVGRFIAKRIAGETGNPYGLYSSMLSASPDQRWLDDCAPAVAVARLLQQPHLEPADGAAL